VVVEDNDGRAATRVGVGARPQRLVLPNVTITLTCYGARTLPWP
jgi:hypothetical protein